MIYVLCTIGVLVGFAIGWLLSGRSLGRIDTMLEWLGTGARRLALRSVTAARIGVVLARPGSGRHRARWSAIRMPRVAA